MAANSPNIYCPLALYRAGAHDGRPYGKALRLYEFAGKNTILKACTARASVASPTLGGYKFPAKFQFAELSRSAQNFISCFGALSVLFVGGMTNWRAGFWHFLYPIRKHRKKGKFVFTIRVSCDKMYSVEVGIIPLRRRMS